MSDGTINIVIGGEAGQGLATVGQLLTKTLVRAGYPVIVSQDYMSRIRGGHNFFCLRTGGQGITAPKDEIDLLVALNEETVEIHKSQLAEGGLVLLDEKLNPGDAKALKIPYKSMIPKALFENVAALGVIAGVLGLPRDVPAGLLGDTFKKKGQEIVDQNVEVLDKAFAWIKEQACDFSGLPEPIYEAGTRLMMNGNEAIAIGAMAAGVKFCSFYPMTPSTSIAQTLIQHSQRMGIVIEQAEDEIAAINMALGASFAGAKALVPTSGGGMALMCEGISLAGMIEQPIVIALAQRGGPATGLPTRTEQADLNLALYAGHGEFPRAIYAPATVEQCFHLTYRAMDAAERFQTPVFVLTDHYLADSYQDVTPFDLGSLPPTAEPGFSTEDPEGYQRHAYTDSGVSPRLIPGFGPYRVVTSSDEHTSDGHITDTIEDRTKMNEKRLSKERGMLDSVISPDLYGEEGAETLLVCWGSTLGAALEASDVLQNRGENAAVLHFSQVWPLKPDQFLSVLESAGRTVCVEGNATGQLAALIRKMSGFQMDAQVHRYDGRAFTAAYILEHLDK